MKQKGLMYLIFILWGLLLMIGLYFDDSIFFVSFTLSWLFVFSLMDFGLISFMSLLISAIVIMRFWMKVYRNIDRNRSVFVLVLVYFLGSWLNYLLIFYSKPAYESWGWVEIVNIAAGITTSLAILGIIRFYDRLSLSV